MSVRIEDPTTEGADEVLFLASNAAYLRLKAGDHPADAVMTAHEILKAWIAVYVDGSWRA